MPHTQTRRHRAGGRTEFLTAMCLCLALVTAVIVGLALTRGSDQAAGASFTPGTRTPPPATRDYVDAYLIGDSVTDGTGGTGRANDRFGEVMAKRLNWSLTTDGVGGSGFQSKGPQANVDARFITRLQSIIDAQPDVVIVAGGRNDLFGSLSDYDAALSEFYTQLREGLPDARIVTIAPWRWDTTKDQVVVPLQAERAQVSKRITDSVGGTFLDPTTDLPRIDDQNSAALLTDDAFHPNAAGNRMVGEALALKLHSLGMPRGPEVWVQSGIGDDVMFTDRTEAFFASPLL
jgi:lysophospholipase L1-like esterase